MNTNEQETDTGLPVVRNSKVLVTPVKSARYKDTIYVHDNATEEDVREAVELFNKSDSELIQRKDVHTTREGFTFIV